MTTKYRVAFPHPSVKPDDRCILCPLEPDADPSDILDQLFVEYPRWVEDLKDATLFKANTFSVNGARF